MSKHWKKYRDEVSISPLMHRLRNELDAAGYEWYDASEERGSDDYIYHMERTKVTRGFQTVDGIELASCIYGFSGPIGHETGSTHGWPYYIEGWPNGLDEPEAMTIEEILEALAELNNRK